MTSKLDEELERLREVADRPQATLGDEFLFLGALGKWFRAGQLVPAQPSGDVVEAVARAICQAETGGPLGYFPDGSPMRNGGVWDEYMPNQHNEWRQSATAAITTYEAVSGVAKMRYRHKKRGTVYEVLGEGVLQCAANPVLDEQPVVIYRGEDGKLWVRGVVEFHDGRFEALGEKP